MTLVREVSEVQVLRHLAGERIVAATAFDAPDQVGRTAAALLDGGVRCLEIAVGAQATTVSAIRAARAVDGLLVGAGNVLKPEQAALAARAGAQFATAPGTNMAVVHTCRELELPFLPGVATPSELERLYTLGVTTMCVFPIAALGGPPFLEAIASVYPGVALVPRGGVRPEMLRTYLAVPAVLAVACSWIVRQDHVQARSFEHVERRAREARATAGTRRS